MPLLTNALTRRSLLQSLGAGIVCTLGAEAQNAAVRWALLSDTHLSADMANAYRGFRPFENLSKVLPEVTAWKPEGLLIDGDLARLEGLAADYERLKSMLEPLMAKTPSGFTMGNHDDRKNFLASFGGPGKGAAQPVKDKHVIVIEAGAVRFILLDSLFEVNVVAGLLGKTQRDWLATYLGGGDQKPTLIFLHHTLDDRDSSLMDADRFLGTVSKHPQVKAVFYGHSHRYAYDTLNGMHLVNLPAVGYNFTDDQPVGWVQALVTKDGADLTLRSIGGNQEANGKIRSLAWRA